MKPYLEVLNSLRCREDFLEFADPPSVRDPEVLKALAIRRILQGLLKNERPAETSTVDFRSGKGYTGILLALTFPFSVVAIDYKGQNYPTLSRRLYKFADPLTTPLLQYVDHFNSVLVSANSEGPFLTRMIDLFNQRQVNAIVAVLNANPRHIQRSSVPEVFKSYSSLIPKQHELDEAKLKYDLWCHKVFLSVDSDKKRLVDDRNLPDIFQHNILVAER